MSFRASRALQLCALSCFVVTAVNHAAPPGTPLAGEAAVSTAAFDQFNAVVARDADGDYVVVWQSDVSATGDGTDYDIYFQRFNRGGVAQGAAVRANETTGGIQQTPAVAMDASGNFVIAWTSDQAETPAGDATGVWARRFTSAGAAQGGEFQVNTYTTNIQERPAVAMDADGDFVVAWQSLAQDGSGQGIYAQRYDNAGAAAGAEFSVNTATANSQSAAAVGMNAAGAFVIAWQSNNQEGVGLVNGIYAQRYTAGGVASGAEQHINTTTAGEQKAPSVGMAANGGFAVAWESPDAGGTGIFARVFDAADNPLTGEIAVNTTTAGEQVAPALAMDYDGDFTVAWQGTDAGGVGVRFQRFNAAGTAQGAEGAANSTTAGSQQAPAIAADADGDFVVAWESNQTPASGFDVYARRFVGPEDVDLQLTQTDAPDPVVSGSSITYTIKVRNNHAMASTGVPALDGAIGAADGITVTDTAPANVTSAGGTNWSCTGAGTTSVNCSYAALLAPGATASDLNVVLATPLTPGEITNTATVTASGHDSVSANNSDSEATGTCALTANPGSIQFTSATFTAGESGTATVSASRTGGTCSAVTATYQTANGTATAGSDYTATSGTLSWAANESGTKSFTVPIISDAVDEPNETFTVTLTPDRATAGSPGTATVTITDDDSVNVRFTAAAQTVAEGAGFSVTAERVGATTFTITVPFTVGGTAGSGDHTAVNGTFTIAPGVTSDTKVFTVNDDLLDEAAETITFTLNTPSGGTVSTATPFVHTVTITDDDATPTVVFTTPDSSFAEGDTGFNAVTVTAELDAPSGQVVTVPFTVSGTATGVGETTASNGSITIPAGSLTGTYTYNVNGDTLYEFDETVVITMGTPTNAIAGADTSHTATITDDDPAPNVTLSLSGSPLAENGGVATVTATVSPASGRETVVHLTDPFGGTAALSADYVRSGISITIPAGSTTGSITLTGVNDAIDEADETIIVDIGTVTNAVEIGVQQVTAAITDDDNPPNVTLTLSGSPLAEEGGVATVSATLAAVSGKDTTIALAYTGTATNAADYTRSAETLVIRAGATTPEAPVTLTGVGDALDEADETIVVDMTCDANCNEATLQRVTATITDDDAPTVSFSVATQTVAENVGMVTVTAMRSGASTFTVSAPYTVSGTASGGSVDHNAVNGTFTIPPSANATESATYTFTVTSDSKDEVDETVIFALGTPTGGSVTAAAPATQTVTITDDDSTTVKFSAATQSVGENVGTVTVTAQRTGATDFTITIPVTVSGTATNPADHNAADGSITILPGNASGSTTFTVVDDALYEDNETVIYTMGSPSGGDVTSVAPSVQTITIDNTNDPAPTVQFSASTQSVAENVAGGTTTITVELSAASGLATEVGFALSGNASHGADYSLSPAAPGPLQIPAGQTSATITATIVNDPADEPNETATLTLTGPTNATLGARTTHTLTILDDDDTPQVSFTTAAQSKAENAGTAAVITVQASRPSSEDINVPFTVTGTAAGSDYTITPSPVTIVAGEVSATITVTPVNDAVDELDETVVVTMGTPANATPSGTTVHTVTITDDDASTLSIGDATVTEGTGAGTTNLVFGVTLSTPSSSTVTVDYATAAGTATATADYTTTSATLSFAPGETSKTISVPVVRDAIDESDETLTLGLSNASGASILDGSGLGTITDDDTATISVADATVTEGTGAGTTNLAFSVTLSTPSASTVTVSYATAAGTATATADYATTSASLTFAPGETSKTVNVSIVRDAIDEADETLTLGLSSPSGAAISDGTGLGTITDDDTATISVADATVTEGTGAGTTNLAFSVTLSTPSSVTVTVDYATAAGTAAATADYTTAAGTLTFSPGETGKTVNVSIVRDSQDENDETLTLGLSNASGASILDGSGLGTITDDDAAPALSIADATVVEGASTDVTLNFTVSLSAASGKTVTVRADTADGTAIAPADYTPVVGSILTFPPGVLTRTVSVTVKSDDANEKPETLLATLSAPVNATLADSQGIGTITDAPDDKPAPTGGGGGALGSLGLLALLVPAWLRRRRGAFAA
jgi:hypothetical protein